MDIVIYIAIAAVVLVGLGYWLLSARKADRGDEEAVREAEEEHGGDDRRPRPAPVAEPVRSKAAEDKEPRPSTGPKETPSAGADRAKGSGPEEVSTQGSGEERAEEARPRTSGAAGDDEGPGDVGAAEEDEEAVARRAERRQAFRKGLKSTRGGFIARLGGLLKGKKKVDAALLDGIEEVMLTADVGVQFTETLKKALEDSLSQKDLEDEETVWAFLEEQAKAVLTQDAPPLDIESRKPFVIMVVGVNGVGKTTTIAKLASRFSKSGKKVILAAGDTFRAAAVRQLEMWGDRVGAEVVKNEKAGADPSSVAFDAVKHAIDTGADVVIADTAGRLHTKAPLMDELKKVKRVMGKALEGAPHEILLVLDANTGQNANLQTREFKETLAVTGIALTKLDGTAKGGVILGICHEHGLPIRFVGVGERDDDLREFDADDFVAVLFERGEGADENAA